MGNTPERSPFIRNSCIQFLGGKLVPDDATPTILEDDSRSKQSFASIKLLPPEIQSLIMEVLFRHEMKIGDASELALDHTDRPDFANLLEEQRIFASLIASLKGEEPSDEEIEEIARGEMSQLEDSSHSDEESKKAEVERIVAKADKENPGLLAKAEKAFKKQRKFREKVISS